MRAMFEVGFFIHSLTSISSYVFTATVLIGITQKYCRETGQEYPFASKGYAIYPVSSKDPKVLDAKFFSTTSPIVVSEGFISRNAFGLHKLPPGDYCIVVYTQSSAYSGQFLLRIFAEKLFS